jgi:hypothetical protein
MAGLKLKPKGKLLEDAWNNVAPVLHLAEINCELVWQTSPCPPFYFYLLSKWENENGGLKVAA